jgi:hypothetical protein
MPGGEHLKIGAGPAHHWPMAVVAQRVGVGELAEIGRIAGGYVAEAHRDRASVGAGNRIGKAL